MLSPQAACSAVGIGASVHEASGCPTPKTTFIFGVIGEELGFFGCVILIGAFAVLLIMGVMIALRAPDLYGTVLGIGIISQIAWQVFLHIAVGTALDPQPPASACRSSPPAAPVCCCC